MDLTGGSLRLFRAAGIDVYLHWSWFLVAVLQITYRPDVYHTGAWKVAEYLALFFIILLHEFGHALACRSVGGRANQIVLWPLGGVAYVAPPPRPGPVLWSIAAGPLVNVVLAVVFFALWSAVPEGLHWQNALTAQKWPDTPDVYRFLGVLIFINLVTLFFNLLPVYPLDGGQIVQSLLWFFVGRWRSLQLVSILGVAFGVLLFGLSLALPGAWMLSVIAAFIAFRSVVGFQQSRVALKLLDLPRHEDCECPSCGLGPPRGPFWVCEHCHTRFDLFDAHAKCPACGAWYLEPDCPHCRRANHIDKWFPAQEKAVSVPPADDPALKGWGYKEQPGEPG
jgi:Zn-dependent protease